MIIKVGVYENVNAVDWGMDVVWQRCETMVSLNEKIID